MRKATVVTAAMLFISTGTTAYAVSNHATALATSSSAVSAATSTTDNPSSKEQNVSSEFQKVTRDTTWQQKEKIDLQFDTYHPQGMVRIGDLFYMSSVQIIEQPMKYDHPQGGYDRSPGRGIGHLFVFDKQGKLLKDIRLGEGSIYHPGGIDFDGKSIWVPVAEYRPNSQAIIYKVNPETMKAQEVFRVHDHIGALVIDRQNHKVMGVNWGSRKFYEWNEQGRQLLVRDNPSYFVDYQDCHYIGQGKAICSGVASLQNPRDLNNPFQLGGLALLDVKTLNTLHEVPITELSPQGRVITNNPVFLESTGQELRLYAVPDDDHSSMLVYETNNLK